MFTKQKRTVPLYQTLITAGGPAALAVAPGCSAIALGQGREERARRRLPAVSTSAGLVVDLGADIGSPRWWRGLFTLCALVFAVMISALGLPSPSVGGVDPRPEFAARPAAPAFVAPASPASVSPADPALKADAPFPITPAAVLNDDSRIDLAVTLGSGGGFGAMLERVGLSREEAGRVSDMVGGATDLDALAAGTVVELTLGTGAGRAEERPLQRLKMRPRFDVRIEVYRENGVLYLRTTQRPDDDLPIRIQGRVGTNLETSARAAGVPARAVDAYRHAIGGGMDADDRFDLIFEQRRGASGAREAGPLIYAGLDRVAGEDMALVRWDGDGSGRWLRPSGQAAVSMGAGAAMRRPLGNAVTSGFGMRRHPILGYYRMHRGVDFGAPFGTPIHAVQDGTVLRAGWSGFGHGRQVRIAHAGGLVTSYSHMSRVAVSPGALVGAGQTIGHVGSTGLSTGPHLHFELLENGVAVDPLGRSTGTTPLTGAEMQAVRARLNALQAIAVSES